jgi:small multidrug resistance family-3 protein
MRGLSLVLLAIAAAMEVGGDALVRHGLRSGRVWGFVAGAAVLFAYGLFVNLPKWDFGRLMGVYIAIFFVVAQLTALFFFKEKLVTPTIVGGILIISGGLLMTFWPHATAATPDAQPTNEQSVEPPAPAALVPVNNINP